MKSSNYDGFIITGAPVEKMDFEDVDYWGQLEEIFSWAKTHVTSTLCICWAGLAGLYYRYGIKKILLDKKLSGVFEHKVYNHKNPIFRGFDDVFMIKPSVYLVHMAGVMVSGWKSGSLLVQKLQQI